MENAETVSSETNKDEAVLSPTEETAASQSPIEEKEEEWTEVYDTEVPEDEGTDTFYAKPTPKPVVSQKKARGIDGAIAAISNGEDPVAAYQTSYLDDESSIEKQAQANLTKSVSKPLSVAGEVSPEAVAMDVSKRRARATDGILGPSYVYIDSLPDSELLTPEERDEAAYLAYVNNTVAESWDKMSKTDVAKDFAQMMLAPDNNFRITDVAKFLGVETDAGDYVLTSELQIDLTKKFNKLPVHARAKMIKDLAENWETFGLFDNKIEFINFTSRLVSMTDDTRVEMFFENIADRADQTVILTGLGKMFKSITKSAGMIPRLAKLGRVDAVRDVAKLGASGALKEVGVDPLDAANTMLPMSNVQKLTDGAPKKLANDILKIDTELQKAVDSFDPLDLPLTDADKTKRIEKAVEAASLEKDVFDVRVVSKTGKDFTLEIDVLDDAPELISAYEKAAVDGLEVAAPKKTRTQVVNYTLNDVGSWEESQQVNRIGEWVWSPNHRLPKIKDDIVEGPFRALLQGSKLRKTLDKTIYDAFSPLSKKSSKKVDALLLKGDGVKDFSFTEAVEIGIDGVKYSDKEYKAYAAARVVSDKLHSLKNNQILEQWKVRNIKIVDINGVKTAGKVYDDGVAAGRALDAGTRHSKWFMMDGKVVTKDLTLDDLKDAYSKGYKLVHADTSGSKGGTIIGGKEFSSSGLFEAGNGSVEWALVKGDGIIDPHGNVLNKVPGYITKMREGANFFLKRKVKTSVGGKEVERLVTERYNSNYTDLENFRKALPNADEYIVLADRQLSSSDLEIEQIKIMGGLFTGGRKSAPIPYGVGEVEGARKTALTSLQTYINNIASSMPISVYREGLRQKWVNTAREAGVLKGFSGTESFTDLAVKIDGMHPKSNFFKQSHNEISFISGIKTTKEINMQETMFKIGRYFENSKIPWGTGIAEIVYSDKLRNIPGAIKTVTYHSMLGLYNPGQVYIQGSGAILAMSANPVHGAVGFAHALEFAILDIIGRKGDAAAFANKFDFNAWKLWDKSGMREAITNSNLDYNSIFNHAPYDAGLIRKALSNSDMFVKMGEMAYSRIAFGTAYDYVKSQLKRVPTDNDLPAILARADQYRLNMSRTNAAKFQKGLVGVPTQFMQVQTKFLEKMLGNDFTTAEKFRIASGQTILLGAVGLPIVGTIAKPIMDYFGINFESEDPEMLAKLQKGALGYWLADEYNMNIDIGSRIALSNDIAERMINMFIAPSLPSTGELIAGPSWSVFGRITDVFQRAQMVGSLAFSADEMDDNYLLTSAQVIAEEALNIPASTRNLMKAVVMAKSGMYHNKVGLPIFHYRDTNFNAVFAQALGFQNTEVMDWYDVGGQSQIFNTKAGKDSYAKMMASTMLKMINAGADRQMVYGAAYNAMMTAALKYKGGEDVLKQVSKLLKTPGTTWHDQMKKGLAIAENEYVEGMEEFFKRANVRTNVTMARELKKYGVE